MLCALKFYMDTRCVEMVRRQESRQTGAEIHTREVHTGNIARRWLWRQRGTWGCKKFATAKQGVYPRGDTFRGILELQLGAVVLKLMVFGRLKKEMGRREPYFVICRKRTSMHHILNNDLHFLHTHVVLIPQAPLFYLCFGAQICVFSRISRSKRFWNVTTATP